jgi:hypothetical protein
MDAKTQKMRLAVDVLLGEPDHISDGLEAELYALRDQLGVMPLDTAGRHGHPQGSDVPESLGSSRSGRDHAPGSDVTSA